MVTSALANKDNWSQNGVVMVQTSKEIFRWHYGYNSDKFFTGTWVFWAVSDLWIPPDVPGYSQNNVCWQPVTATLLFKGSFLYYISRQGNCFRSYINKKKRHVMMTNSPRVGKIPWRRKWQPFQYFCLKNLVDRGAWWATVQGVAETSTWPAAKQK